MLTFAADNLLAARQMTAFTLGAHILLAMFGVAFPLITLVANYRGIKQRDPVQLDLARRWSKAMAVLFAVGAVTGTMLTFEFGLLWPGLMGQWGDVIGVMFAMEGIFFFTEAIFIAIYIYGWDRLKPWHHFWTGVPIVIAGMGGTYAIVTVNAWMQTPQGFTLDAAGEVVGVNPWKVMTNPAMFYQVPHMFLAAYMTAGFLIASVYAVAWLRGRRDRRHRLGFLIPFVVAAIATPINIAVGDTAAREVLHDQPLKYAAMEVVTESGPDQPEVLFGWFDEETGQIDGAIEIPGLNSLLAGFSTNTEITGLDAFDPDLWPPVNIVHYAFDIMVAIGVALLGLSAWFAFVWWRKRDLPTWKPFWWAASVAGAASVVAVWAGWTVTEVGRQPWIVYEIMLTEDAVTTNDGVWWWFGLAIVVYLALFITAAVVLLSMSRRWREGEAEPAEVEGTPYGPRGETVLEPPDLIEDDTGAPVG